MKFYVLALLETILVGSGKVLCKDLGTVAVTSSWLFYSGERNKAEDVVDWLCVLTPVT